MRKRQQIKTVITSLRGAWHKAKNMPCQDCCRSKIKNNKVVAVVSDGAGSACYSSIGARVVCETLCDLLINSDIRHIEEDVVKAITVARDKLILHRLNKAKSAAGLVDFSATMVGVFYQHNKGIFFHIGDGAGIAFKQGDYSDFVISEPENGAFSCETYFYTMSDWRDCLRFTPFVDKNRLMLMTDGVTGFVFSDDFYRIRQSFLQPVAEFLENETRTTYAEKALRNTLDDKKAQRLNADDKTVFWAKIS